MNEDVIVGLDGEFEFEIPFHRILTDHEDFHGDWEGPTVKGVTALASTRQTEPLEGGRYLIRGQVLLPAWPGNYENTVSEVWDMLSQPVEQVRPRFPTLIVQSLAAPADEYEG